MRDKKVNESDVAVSSIGGGGVAMFDPVLNKSAGIIRRVSPRRIIDAVRKKKSKNV
jgi:hypothetical protein